MQLAGVVSPPSTSFQMNPCGHVGTNFGHIEFFESLVCQKCWEDPKKTDLLQKQVLIFLMENQNCCGNLLEIKKEVKDEREGEKEEGRGEEEYSFVVPQFK